MRYQRFLVKNYKAIKDAEIDLSSEGLVLLLGINESGKTSVLRALESFDYTNDPEEEGRRNKFYKSIRNKKENVTSVASVAAEIVLEKGDLQRISEILSPVLTGGNVSVLNPLKKITIRRQFNYQNAEFTGSHYGFVGELETLLTPGLDGGAVDSACKNVLGICPNIQYFEDFKDQIPDNISLESGAEWYNPDWASTIEGLFFHADPALTASQFQGITDANARQTTLNKVNLALNKQFTSRWNTKLKGVKSISHVELFYEPAQRLFTFRIVGADKSTVFAIDERSKGALWYFTFLLKTEFRKRKLRAQLGKTLYLIDEPGSNLHSSAQINMVSDFRTLASDSNVIYTTHSQYLIDKENLTNVYIVEYRSSVVRVTKYQQYVQGKSIKTSYYQPIIDALEIQPFSLDTPWKKALIVEGVYDYCGMRLMFEMVSGVKPDFSIIPGTGATGHNTLISLHLGWGAKVYVLLDSDQEGKNASQLYKAQFPTIEQNIETISDIIPGKIYEFENLFTDQDKQCLAKLAGYSGAVNKTVIQQALAQVLYSPKLSSQLKSQVSVQTKDNFKKILQRVKSKLA